MKHFYLKFAKTTLLKSLLGIVLLLGMQGMQAQITSTGAGGAWSVGATWAGGIAPGAGDNVVIAGPVTMDVNLTMTAGTSVTVNDGAALSINAGITSTFDTLTVGTTLTTATCTNLGTLTVRASLAGTGTFNTTANASILNLTGAITVATLNTGSTGNTGTVNYNGNAQTIKDTGYRILITSGTGTKTWALGANRTAGSKLIVSSGAPLIITSNPAANVWTFGTGANSTISDALTFDSNSGIGTKTFGAGLIINTGGSLIEGVAATTYTFSGNITVNGTLSSNTGTHNFNGTGSIISGGTISIGNITIGGTVTNLCSNLSSNTFFTINSGASLTNNGIITSSTISGLGTFINGSTGVLNATGSTSVTTFTATAAGNTVNYSGGSQTVKITTFSNLTLSGSGTKTIGTAASGTLCTGTLSLLGTATATVTNTDVQVNNLLIGGIGKIAGTWGTGQTNTDAKLLGTGYLTVGSTTTTWDGTGWTPSAPTSADPVAIAGNYSTTTNGVFTAKKLTVSSGVLTINTGTNLTIVNEIANNAAASAVVVENNANLIQTNNVGNTGAITVKRNSNPLYRLDYTLWSSPTGVSQKLNQFSPLTSTGRFYEYNPTTNVYNVVAAATPFSIGKGFLIRMPNTDPTSGYDAGSAPLTFNGVFTGVPNNGNVTVAGTAGQFVAVGNPYPSTISAASFFTGNANAGTTLYFWRRTNGAATGPGTAYATYTNVGGTTTTASSPTPNGIIQIGQGFIVNTGTATAINFTNAMRVADNANQIFKTKAVAQKDRVWINLTNADGAFSQMLVGYMDGATTGVDAGIDGLYINDAATALTSDIAGGEYVIQGRPAFDATDVVALNFKVENAGTFTIAKDHADGLFATGQDVYLVDATNGSETNLHTNAYTFTAAAGASTTRFSLKYQKTLKVTAAAFNDNSVLVYSNNGTISVNSGASAISNIKVYDIQGRLLAEQKEVNTTSATIKNLRASQQVLLVKVTAADNTVVTKKVIN